MTTSDTPQTLLVQLRSVPDCPNLPATRQRLLDILAETTTPWTLTELEGDYPSPSILVNGVDVTGATPDSPAACVLHPPTADQIRAALADATPWTTRPQRSPTIAARAAQLHVT